MTVLPGAVQSLGLSLLICTMGTNNNKLPVSLGIVGYNRCERLILGYKLSENQTPLPSPNQVTLDTRCLYYVTEFLGVQ